LLGVFSQIRNYMNWFVDVIKRPVEFNGRARRREYWYFFAVSLGITLLLSLIDNVLGWYDPNSDIGLLSGIFSLLILLPGLSVTIRRLHDTNRTGWWVLLYLVPVIGFFILSIFLILDSNMECNKYGDNPKLSNSF
ncbi:DUF805 domain-containing protein, partial [Vibrio sp. 10N.261.52.A1]|uniref:DUF805 domain-containing protein n=2 Tax=Vibrio TaxID=662 RepID=UPI001F52D203